MRLQTMDRIANNKRSQDGSRGWNGTFNSSLCERFGGDFVWAVFSKKSKICSQPRLCVARTPHSPRWTVIGFAIKLVLEPTTLTLLSFLFFLKRRGVG